MSELGVETTATVVEAIGTQTVNVPLKDFFESHSASNLKNQRNSVKQVSDFFSKFNQDLPTDYSKEIGFDIVTSFFRFLFRNKTFQNILLAIQNFSNIYSYVKSNTVDLQFLNSQFQKISELYTFRSGSLQILNFLIRNEKLLHFVIEAKAHISDYFPEDELILEIISDPEEDEDEEIVIYVRTNLQVEEALPKLNEFDESWFLNAITVYGENLCIDLEYV